MSRRLPKYVKVLSQKVGVVVVKGLIIHDDDSADGHVSAYGTWQPGVPLIALDSESGPERKKQTFLHENLHAMFAIAGILEDDEELVNRLAPVLLAWLRENKPSVLYLQEV